MMREVNQSCTNDFNRLLLKPYLVVSTSTQGDEKNKYITFEEFSRVHLKIGKVIQAKDVPGMKKVFKVTVDIGDEQRDLAVGAALHYKPEELVGKVVVVCTNLEPKKIGSIISNGMLLAAVGDEGRPIFLTITEDVNVGAIIQ